jgi:predicted signal transduction protein with EAL and GGDEF domain
VARLGGDEFAVLLDDVHDVADATHVADRVLESLRGPMRVAGSEVNVSASIGIARAGGADAADALLRNADVAMYRAKQRGKGGHEVFVPEMHAALVDRLELEADLRHALADQSCAEFTMLYQPIVELATGRPIGVEALVRWEHPRRGLVSPATFIPLAESTGLIIPLGNWVMREACVRAAAWQSLRDEHLDVHTGSADPAPLTVTVNLSGRQLQHPGIVEEVASALSASGLPAERLVLEITESVIMQDTEANLAVLHALKSLGVRLAIDDFGTGYSSLSYLQKFPIDILKIDKAFVDGVGRGGSDEALARTIVALGDMLSVRCVAEGIEDEQQRMHLLAIGCDFGQGYLFTRPMTSAAVEAIVCRPELPLAT